MELSPDSTRGFLSSFYEVFMVIGEILGNVIVYTTSNSSDQLKYFRLILGLGTVLWFLLTLAALALPESPCWLVEKGRDGDAKQVLAKTSNSEGEVASRLKDIKLAAGQIPENIPHPIILLPRRSAAIVPWIELFVRPSPSVRRALIVAIGINFFRNATGIDVVRSSSSNAFLMGDKFNNPKFDLLQIIVAIIALINISLNIVAGYLMDKIGRRPLLLTSLAGIVPSLVGVGLSLAMYSRSDEELTWSFLYIAMLLFCNVFFSIGLGPITWLYSTEVFPMHLRAQGASVGGAVNWVTSGVVDYIFFINGKAISGGAYFIFAGIASVGLVFFWNLLTETLGKSSEEYVGRASNRVDAERLEAESENSPRAGCSPSVFSVDMSERRGGGVGSFAGGCSPSSSAGGPLGVGWPAVRRGGELGRQYSVGGSSLGKVKCDS